MSGSIHASFLSVLPLRSRDEHAEATPEENIRDTFGGKAIHYINHYFFGGVVNFLISMGITFFLNPRPETKRAKDAVTNGISNLFGGLGSEAQEKIRSGARSGLEVMYMYAAGIIATIIMTPLIVYQEQIAYRINKIFGRDTDVLPAYMRQQEAPKTAEERIEQALAKKVNYGHSAWDLWKARFVTMGIVWLGDQGNEMLTRVLEKKNLYSMDTLLWRIGHALGTSMPKKWTMGLGKWLASHGAGIEDMRTNMGPHFDRLERSAADFTALGNPVPDDGKKAIAESFRLAGKESIYMVPLTILVSKFTHIYSTQRIAQQQSKAIADLKKRGFIPKGYKIHVSQMGKVELSPIAGYKQLSMASNNEEYIQDKWSGKTSRHKQPIKSQGYTVSAPGKNNEAYNGI